MKVFLICPVRGATDKETKEIDGYVKSLEDKGIEVYWPARDTCQTDPIGYAICCANWNAIREADEIHVWYNPTSQGSLFDLGMAFELCKPIFLANRKSVAPTDGKSFANFLLYLDAGKNNR
jgi:nucleoside 2-deoxyribosyltransferase